MGALLHAAPQVSQPVPSPNIHVTNTRTIAAEAFTRLATDLGVPPAALQRKMSGMMMAPQAAPQSTPQQEKK